MNPGAQTLIMESIFVAFKNRNVHEKIQLADLVIQLDAGIKCFIFECSFISGLCGQVQCVMVHSRRISELIPLSGWCSDLGWHLYEVGALVSITVNTVSPESDSSSENAAIWDFF